MTKEKIYSYIKDTTSSDYNNLLVVSCYMIYKVNEMIDLHYQYINDNNEY